MRGGQLVRVGESVKEVIAAPGRGGAAGPARHAAPVDRAGGRLLVERVTVGAVGAEIQLNMEGLAGLARDMATKREAIAA